MDFAGVVAGVGEGGDRFSVGGGVFGTTDAAGGAFAEYLVAPVGLVKGLGADEVVDYTQEDIVRTSSIRGNLKYDRIVDCVGNRSMGAWKGLLKPRGDFVAVSLGGTCARTHNTH